MERRKARRTSQRRMHSPVPATSEHRSPQRTPTRSPSPIELDTVVASEVDEWRTSANMRRRQTNVFNDVRSIRDAQSLAIDTPSEDSRPSHHIPQHAYRNQSPLRPQVPSPRASLSTIFLPSSVADSQPCVLCHRCRLHCIIGGCDTPGTNCGASV